MCKLLFQPVGVIAFLILRDGVEAEDKEIVKSLKELVRKKIAAFAIPTAFVVRLYLQKCNSAWLHGIIVLFLYNNTNASSNSYYFKHTELPGRVHDL